MTLKETWTHFKAAVNDRIEMWRHPIVVYYDFVSLQPRFLCGRCNEEINVLVTNVRSQVNFSYEKPALYLKRQFNIPIGKYVVTITTFKKP